MSSDCLAMMKTLDHTSCLTGFRRQCVASDSGVGTPLFRSRYYERQRRVRKKLISREAWFRSNSDVIGFIPASPGGALVKGIQKIVKEEGEKIGIKIRVSEQSGTSIGALLTTPDLSGCLYPRCTISEYGASHSRRGANYSGTCLLCGDIYKGETGFGAHTRVQQHREDIRRNADHNSMALHLAEKHPDHRGDPESVVFSVSNTGNRPMLRQIREAVQISNTNPGQIINGRTEYL